ncbi:hypothetical protein D3C73_1034050 [compost metagenome]
MRDRAKAVFEFFFKGRELLFVFKFGKFCIEIVTLGNIGDILIGDQYLQICVYLCEIDVFAFLLIGKYLRKLIIF